eukprot:163675-Rhodomonas_salina.2
MLAQGAEHLLYVEHVLLLRLTVDQGVVNVNATATTRVNAAKQVADVSGPEHVFNVPLEGGRHVGQSKHPHQPLVMPQKAADGSGQVVVRYVAHIVD